jgi:uncharacterized protein (TIGR03435 family)
MRNQPVHALFLTAVLLELSGRSFSAQVPTAFDNTEITPPNKNVGGLLEQSDDTIAAAQITLLDLLKLKYGNGIRIVGLTHEQETTRFDMVTKIDPPGVSDPVHNPKAQTFLIDALLKNHFNLKAHEGLIDITTQQLIALPDNTKLTPSPPRCPCSYKIIVTSDHVKGERIIMPVLAAKLSKELGVEIHDQTNLTGTYSIDLDWSPEALARLQPLGLLPPPYSQSPEQLLRQALETQLGLTLLPTHRQELGVIIDYVELPASVWPDQKPDSTQTALSSSH